MAENFRHGLPEELAGWLYKKQRLFPARKKRYFKLASQVLSSHVRNVSYFFRFVFLSVCVVSVRCFCCFFGASRTSIIQH